jgi:hypothetical protein
MSFATLFLVCLALYVLLRLFRGAKTAWRCTVYLEGMLEHSEIFHGYLYLIDRFAGHANPFTASHAGEENLALGYLFALSQATAEAMLKLARLPRPARRQPALLKRQFLAQKDALLALQHNAELTRKAYHGYAEVCALRAYPNVGCERFVQLLAELADAMRREACGMPAQGWQEPG